MVIAYGMVSCVLMLLYEAEWILESRECGCVLLRLYWLRAGMDGYRLRFRIVFPALSRYTACMLGMGLLMEDRNRRLGDQVLHSSARQAVPAILIESCSWYKTSGVGRIEAT